jgi:hypothetical protein
MDEQPKLSQAEWELVIELLEHEHHDLPAEIHHTRIARYREELRERHQMVTDLLHRLRGK